MLTKSKTDNDKGPKIKDKWILLAECPTPSAKILLYQAISILTYKSILKSKERKESVKHIAIY